MVWKVQFFKDMGKVCCWVLPQLGPGLCEALECGHRFSFESHDLDLFSHSVLVLDLWGFDDPTQWGVHDDLGVVQGVLLKDLTIDV